MDIQNIIVAVIVITAAVYAGRMILQKVKSFSPKQSSCASDCGCDGKKTSESL